VLGGRGRIWWEGGTFDSFLNELGLVLLRWLGISANSGRLGENKMDRNLTVREKCEGRDRFYNIGTRVAGLGMYSLSMICISTGSPLALLGLPLVIEGAGDALTGHHHYVSRKVYEFFGGKNWFGKEEQDSRESAPSV